MRARHGAVGPDKSGIVQVLPASSAEASAWRSRFYPRKTPPTAGAASSRRARPRPRSRATCGPTGWWWVRARRPGRSPQARREPARRPYRPAGRARGGRRCLRAQLRLRHRPAAQCRRGVRGAYGRARIHPPQPGGDRLSRHLRDAERNRLRLHPSRQVPRSPHRTRAREDPGTLRAHAGGARRALSLGRGRRPQARARHVLSHVGALYAGRAAHEPGGAHQGPRLDAARERDAARVHAGDGGGRSGTASARPRPAAPSTPKPWCSRSTATRHNSRSSRASS